MKPTLMALLALCLFVFTACSKDDLNESLEQNKSLEVKETLNFKLDEAGTFQWENNSYCESNGIFVLTGQTANGGIGEMTTRMIICNFNNRFSLEGTHVTDKGEELYFTAKEIKEDIVQGAYRITLTYTGGTGSFENATGQVEVLSSEAFQGKLKYGQYDFKGQGTVIY